MKKKKYIQIKDLGVYQQALEVGKEGWEIYKNLDWQVKKILGDQFIMAIDSIGANIAEGYGRFHWLRLLLHRKIVSEESAKKLAEKLEKLNHSLNVYIKTVYKTKDEISV